MFRPDKHIIFNPTLTTSTPCRHLNHGHFSLASPGTLSGRYKQVNPHTGADGDFTQGADFDVTQASDQHMVGSTHELSHRVVLQNVLGCPLASPGTGRSLQTVQVITQGICTQRLVLHTGGVMYHRA